MLGTLVDAARWSRADPERVGPERFPPGSGEVELWPRNHNSFVERFPKVAAASVMLASGMVYRS